MAGVSGTEVTEDSVVVLRCLVSGCGLPDLLKLALLPVLGFGTAEPRDEEYRCQCQFKLFLAFTTAFHLQKQATVRSAPIRPFQPSMSGE
jgi:hypothetical protein